MNTSRRRFLSSSLAAGAGLSLLPRGALAQDTLPMALITPSPVADVGWSHTLLQGAQAAAEAVGGSVSMLENIPEGPDADRIMQKAVAEGARFLIAGSFGYQNGALQIARRYPDVSVLHASGYEVAPNFSPFAARYFQGTYLMGMAAASLSKTGKLGSVSAFAIPELITSVNAFALGARAVNPDAEVSVVWVNSWFDPAKEQEAARALISQGIDVIFSNAQDTPSVISLCEEQGAYAFNLNSSMKSYAPSKYLGVVGTDWSPFFTAQAQAHLDGSFQGASHWLGMEDGVVFVADWNPDIPADAKTRIDETQARIADGSFSPFAGPLIRADGSQAVAEGGNLADDAILAMDWHVQGVVTPLPQ
ncbi:BMP family ABC transporter substrate-binding protein [Rubellimicrobium rubrum]|uniref:BMP family ABC transporter substrate-binding protein n=1 Tax=Rubellimicrobium rubrum TaxID=2585369 RepID=UPI001FEAA6FD|nr:BMP family ABC transporter substrate-binding protein [Rubellimicrobium rubrum]